MDTVTGGVALRPIEPADAGVLRGILAAPEVAAWWGPVPDGFPATDDPDSTRFAIVVDGRVRGLVQFGEEPDPDYRYAAVDIFVDPAVHGRGIGTAALRAMVEHLVRERGHHRVTIDPAAHNHAAVRAYEKAGFRRVGVMRRAERAPDGRWRDALFMEHVVGVD
jgi:aminoglycoside 6'-N-acetyltransferase